MSLERLRNVKRVCLCSMTHQRPRPNPLDHFCASLPPTHVRFVLFHRRLRDHPSPKSPSPLLQINRLVLLSRCPLRLACRSRPIRHKVHTPHNQIPFLDLAQCSMKSLYLNPRSHCDYKDLSTRRCFLSRCRSQTRCVHPYKPRTRRATPCDCYPQLCRERILALSLLPESCLFLEGLLRWTIDP